MAEGNLVGDPLEKQCFEGVKFKQASDGSRVSSGFGCSITQIKKYLFNSSLKRMSVIVQINDQVGSHYRVLSKGAPEILKKFMKEVPADYDSLYLKHVKEGSRVLALAYKPIQKMSQLEFNSFTREQAECDLIFSGFIVAECPLKPDTKSVI